MNVFEIMSYPKHIQMLILNVWFSTFLDQLHHAYVGASEIGLFTFVGLIDDI